MYGQAIIVHLSAQCHALTSAVHGTHSAPWVHIVVHQWLTAPLSRAQLTRQRVLALPLQPPSRGRERCPPRVHGFVHTGPWLDPAVAQSGRMPTETSVVCRRCLAGAQWPMATDQGTRRLTPCARPNYGVVWEDTGGDLCSPPASHGCPGGVPNTCDGTRWPTAMHPSAHCLAHDKGLAASSCEHGCSASSPRGHYGPSLLRPLTATPCAPGCAHGTTNCHHRLSTARTLSLDTMAWPLLEHQLAQTPLCSDTTQLEHHPA